MKAPIPIGSIAYIADFSLVPSDEPCPVCEGSGNIRVEVRTGRVYLPKCPSCEGSGEAEKVRVPKALEKYVLGITQFGQGRRRKISYHLAEVGCFTTAEVFPEESVHTSEEGAIIEAEKRLNAAAREEGDTIDAHLDTLAARSVTMDEEVTRVERWLERTKQRADMEENFR